MAALSESEVLAYLDDVRQCMAEAMAKTALAPLIDDARGLLGSGKMLRARLVCRVGRGMRADQRTLRHCGAAVEMIHAASLLHDDVIDGGFLRRNYPTFWVERGVPGAILLGDMLLFKSMQLVSEVENGRLTNPFIVFAGQLCQSETEQELVYRGRQPQWENCLSIARGKTGALFAFAALAGAGSDADLGAALQEAGYRVGTAYQLADDLLDISGDEDASGKTLGTDEARQKTTAARAAAVDRGIDPVAAIWDLCREGADLLAPWPRADAAFREYLECDFTPSVMKILALLRS